MPDEIEDLLKTLYELNEHYHDVKERVVWLAGVIYLTFSVATMAWYFQNRDTIPILKGLEEWHAVVFLSAIFILTAVFICRQTWEKVRSEVKTEQFNDLIEELPRCRTHTDLINANRYNFNKKRKPVRDFVCIGWSGHLILGVVYSFFVAQMVALYSFPKCWGLRILLVLPILAVLSAPPLVPCKRKSKKKKCCGSRIHGEVA